MENDAQKDVKNIRTISRLALVDEAYQDIYCREELSFVQMLLLCQMAMYGVPKDIVQELAHRSADTDEIKQVFREQILTKAFTHYFETEKKEADKNDKDIKKIMDMVSTGTNSIARMFVKQDETMAQRYDILLQKLENLFKIQEAEDRQLKNDILSGMERRFEQRKYSLMENTAWKKIKSCIGQCDTKKLSMLVRALDAGIMPSKIAPYLGNSSTEQFALIVCILTRQNESKEGGKMYGK